MEIYKEFEQILDNVREKKPLVHHITNYVTVNDCANIVLALGGSPVMADAVEEVSDMVSIASALVINMGTLNHFTVESMIKAGKKANEIGVPVIFDPVGVGATPFRKETALKLINEIKFSVIRGNAAEIKILGGMDAESKGVDSEEASSGSIKNVARDLANKLNTVVAITGVTDYISDGKRVISLDNGVRMLRNVTGTGCMTTSLIGTYCGAADNYFYAAVLGILTMSIAGEIAFERLSDGDGSGSFRVKIIDAVSNLKGEEFQKRGNMNEY